MSSTGDHGEAGSPFEAIRHTTAPISVAEPVADDASGLPVFDWRGIQRRVWELTDLLQWHLLEEIAPLVDAFQRQQQQRIETRQRITAARQRARIITRAKAASNKSTSVE